MGTFIHLLADALAQTMTAHLGGHSPRPSFIDLEVLENGPFSGGGPAPKRVIGVMVAGTGGATIAVRSGAGALSRLRIDTALARAYYLSTAGQVMPVAYWVQGTEGFRRGRLVLSGASR